MDKDLDSKKMFEQVTDDSKPVISDAAIVLG